MSWIDDAFNEDKNKNSWIDDAFAGASEPSSNDYYENSPSQESGGEPASFEESYEEKELPKEPEVPEYSVQAAAEEANGGKSNLQSAIADVFEGQEKSELQKQYEDANILQKIGMLAKGIDRQAYNQFMGGISGTAASLIGEGTIADKIYKTIAGQDAVNHVSEWNEARQKRTALDQQEFGQMTSGDKVSSAVNKYGTMAWSQAPSAMLSIMMAPISATAGATTAGLEYASSLAQSAGLQRFATTAAHGLGEMVKNPQFLLSYSQEAGNAYNGALQDGATPEQASLYASLYGTFSAMIENGGVDENLGGMQNYPKAVQDAVKNHDAKTAAVEFAKSIMGEIGEEWQQGGLENLLKRGYGKDIPWYSTEDPNAVINPNQMLETARDTAITTALMQGGQHAVMSGINAAQNRLYDTQAQRQNEIAEQVTSENKTSATDAVKAAFGEQADIPAPQAETQQVETSTSATPQTEQPTWDGESYKGYTLEAGHGHDGDTVYRIISPDGRAIGETESIGIVKLSAPPADVVEMVENDIAKNGQPASPQTPLSPTTEDAVVTDEVPKAPNNPTPQAPQPSTPSANQSPPSTPTNTQTNANTTQSPSAQPTNAQNGAQGGQTQNNNQAGNGQNWSGPQVQTQSTFHRQLTDQEKTRPDLNPDNDTHTQHHDTEVDTFASDRITQNGHDGARNDLMSRNPSDWDDVDVRTAQMLLTEELNNARTLTGVDQDNAYKRIAELKNAYNQQGTEDARALRQRRRFGGSKTEIVSEAANILYGDENKGKLRKLSPEQKGEIMKQIDEFSTDLEDIKTALQNSPENPNNNSSTNNSASPNATPLASPNNTSNNSQPGTPTNTPSNAPTNAPSNSANNAPNNSPGSNPSSNPSNTPSNSPTTTPTTTPTGNQNAAPFSLKDLILLVAKYRNTQANFDANQVRLGKIIDAVSNMNGGNDFLINLATTQIRSIATDQIKPSFWDKAKAVRYLFMLSNPATASRNVGANTVFGNIVDAISADMASPIDALMSMATGNRTVSTERISKEGLQGSIEAGLKSWLEVTLDAEAEQSSYAYNEIKGRTFKANSNSFIDRFMSALERNQGYQLKTTDQIAKGGIEAETRRSLIAKGVDPDKATELAKEEAKYRTLQNESGVSKAAQGLRGTLNNLFSIKGKDGKPVYGLGEDILPFAQVPANVVKTELDLNPLSIFKASAQIFNVMSKGQNATVQEQRAAAKAFGQAVNGTAIVALAALMSAKGIIRYTDDEDKDQKQLHKAQGKSGLQLNISAAGRMFSFGNPAQRENDKWISLGWMPQLNSLLIIGNMVYDDYKDMPEHKDLADWANFAGDVAVDSLQGMYKSILEFPAVSTITSMINAAKYVDIPEDATAEEATAIKAGAILADKAANTITSFVVPNAMRAVAAGLDDTERNLYGAETRVGQAIDSIKAGIPDNPLIPQKYTRGSLPALTDNLGNPFKNDGGANQFLNKVVYPGAVTRDKDLPVLDEIDRVATATGNMDAIPKKNGAYSVTHGEEKFKLTNEESEAWHQFAGDRIEKYTGDLINSKYYSLMSDEQKAEAMEKINQQAYSEADKNFLSSKGIETTNKLLDGVEKPGDTAKDKTALEEKNVAKYFAFKTMFDTSLKDGDFANADQLAKWYKGLDDENLKTVLHEQDSDLKRVLEYQKIGLGSETYSKVKAQLPSTQEDLDASSDSSGYVRLYAIANADIPEKDRAKIVEQLMNGENGFVSTHARAAYSAMKSYNFTVKQAAEFFDIALHCKTWKNTGDKADMKGQFHNDTAAFAIMQIPGLSASERSAIYNSLRSKLSNKYNDWGRYSYQDEVKYVTKATNKATYSSDIKITDNMDVLLSAAKK